MSTENGAEAVAGTVAPPAGESGNGKTYTEEEVQAKLRGQGKQLETLQQQLKAFQDAEAARRAKDEEDAKAKLAGDGKFETLAAQAEAKSKSLEEQLQQLTQRETDRLTRVAASNDARISALPASLQSLIPPGLDADSTSEQIGRLEALAKVQTVSVHGGPGRVTGPLTDEDKRKAHAEALAAKGRAFIHGPSTKE